MVRLEEVVFEFLKTCLPRSCFDSSSTGTMCSVAKDQDQYSSFRVLHAPHYRQTAWVISMAQITSQKVLSSPHARNPKVRGVLENFQTILCSQLSASRPTLSFIQRICCFEGRHIWNLACFPSITSPVSMRLLALIVVDTPLRSAGAGVFVGPGSSQTSAPSSTLSTSSTASSSATSTPTAAFNCSDDSTSTGP